MKTRKQRGGTRIAEGATSYIIYPSPACESRNNLDSYVARLPKRLTTKSLLTKSYPKLLKILKKIDPFQEYFYYPESCNVKTLTEENKQDGITTKSKRYIEIVRKGDEKWFDWRNPSAWSEPTQDQLSHLQKAIDLLHKNKIVHGDLHGDNIIYGDDRMPRIIDFTESVHDAPDDYIKQEEALVQRGWPTLEYYKVYETNTPEGIKINELRKKRRRELIKTRRTRTKSKQ